MGRRGSGAGRPGDPPVEIVGELLPRFSFPAFLFVLDATLALRVAT